MSDQLDIDAIEARANAATPGEWHPDFDHRSGGSDQITFVAKCNGKSRVMTLLFMAIPSDEEQGNSYEDVTFIAAARTDVPALCLEVRRLRKQVEELQRMQVVTTSPAVVTPERVQVKLPRIGE
jgi:hypothetical protein